MSQVAIIGLVVVCCVSSSASAALSGGQKTPSPPSALAEEPAEEPASSIPSGWRVEEGIDYPGNDIFHYHPGSNPVANESVCLDKCASMDNCKLVTFNNAKTLCWGKNTATNRKPHGDRNNYFKPSSIPPGWRVEENIDYPGNDIFHYHPGSNPVANESVCLDKCASMDNCKLVTFNNAKTLCWGKNTAANPMSHGDRNNYFKQ